MSRTLFLGDVFLPAPLTSRLELPETFVYNLEYAITAATRGWPRKVNLKAERDHARTTFGRLPTAVCLANNHVVDFGPEGLRDTLDALGAEGVPAFGAGDLASRCNNPVLVDVGSRRVGLVGYVCAGANPVFATEQRPGVAPIDVARIAEDVRRARAAGAERVVVSLHWGIEEIELPPPSDIETGRRVAEIDGVDLVIGHHAHCVLPWEVHRGVPIFYGLGNAIFPDVDLPAEYDDRGVPTARFKKIQQSWNKRSLGVLWDADSNVVEPWLLQFDGGELRRVAGDAEAYRLRDESPDTYAARFRRAYTVGTIRNKVMRYISDPKLPEPRHLRSVVRIAREAIWKGSA